MKIYFILHPKHEKEKVNSYSLVDDEVLKTIPKEHVFKKKLIANKIYTKEELEAFRDELL